MEPSSSIDGAGIESATVRRSLPCIGCGYQLRGMRVGRACPECGTPVVRTIMAVVDPLASGLPTLRRPRLVADALFGLVACIAGGCLLLAPRPLAARLELSFGGPPGTWLGLAPPWLPWVAAGLLALALAFVALLAPPPGEEPDAARVTRGIRRLRLGLVGWIAATVGFAILDVRPPFDATGQALFLLMAGAAIVTFLALRATVRVIGERSRQYRTGRGARQGFREMAAAVGGVAIGQVVHALGSAAGVQLLGFVGLLLAWVSAGMLLVGLVYMVVNAAWIRHALVSPPPTMAELLGTPGQPPGGSGDPADAGGDPGGVPPPAATSER